MGWFQVINGFLQYYNVSLLISLMDSYDEYSQLGLY